jgi:hypothetical protein
LPVAELLRENKRMLDRAIRELDRERMGLQQQEKKLIMEIKKMAKEGQMVGALRRTCPLARRITPMHPATRTVALCWASQPAGPPLHAHVSAHARVPAPLGCRRMRSR